MQPARINACSKQLFELAGAYSQLLVNFAKSKHRSRNFSKIAYFSSPVELESNLVPWIHPWMKCDNLSRVAKILSDYKAIQLTQCIIKAILYYQNNGPE